jgi:hypothetical protein
VCRIKWNFRIQNSLFQKQILHVYKHFINFSIFFFTGKAAEDGLKLCNLDLKVGFKIMMMGSLEQDITTASTAPEIVDEVVNDLDLTEEEIALENREEYLAKVRAYLEIYCENF